MELKLLQDYQEASKKFNKLSFKNKILTLINHKNELILGYDAGCWNVQVKNKEIQEQLEELDQTFNIETEWVNRETQTLIGLLGLEITDY